MRSSTPLWLVVIIAITILAIWISLPSNPSFTVQPGLDIQGGLRVLLAADTGVGAGQLDEARQIISRRVNGLGVAEPVVETSGNTRIVVEIPGVRDPKAALDLIKQTGLLEFVDFSPTGTCTSSTAFPAAGQFIITDEQIAKAGGAPFTVATPAATGAATAAATSVGTANLTNAPTLAPAITTVVAPTTVPAQIGTVSATQAAALPSNPGGDTFKFAPQQATSAATTTVQPTAPAAAQTALAPTAAQPTAQATSPATQAQSATAQSTAGATAVATGAATPASAVHDGSSKDKGLLNPCTNAPFHTIMDGSGLQTASSAIGGSANNQYVVNFTLATNDEGNKFGPFTASHLQQPMAIVLDGQVLSAPVIQARLDTGGQITGNFTQEQASTLALELQYGALPISMHVESTEQVGASLGADSVAATGRAGVLGVIVVLIFMIISYRVPGIVAALALLLFAGINFSLYKVIPVTLTLPSITGFLISIGTAVDGNILIFERMKEELRLGRTLEKAVQVGFERAWPSIRDSNISTIMVGAILYFFGGQFGAGSVRGFAITLMLGLVTNLFTAVIVSRTLLDVALRVAGDALRSRKWTIGL